jgi:serine protease Do
MPLHRRHRLQRPLAPCVALLLAAAIPAAAAEKDVTAKVQSETAIALPSLAPLVERVLPAVVNVSVELGDQAATEAGGDSGEGGQITPGNSPFDQFLKRFFENPLVPGAPGAGQHGEKIVAVGSGFIIDPDGYIVTNNHVAGSADKITVILQDNTRHTAKLIGHDEKTDLALIKIDAKQQLPYVSWGNSDDAKVGDWVVAVGNPFGLGGTVTAGIISALGRNLNEGPFDDFLQIDAPINRGNSGGPTFDLSGRVIGINTAIYSPSGGSVGIGFAIPAKLAQKVVAQLKDKGHATWAWLGVTIQAVTPSIAKSLGLDPDRPQGALVAAVSPDSPAAKAGLKQGDLITAAGDHEIKTVHDLPRVVAATPIGQKLNLVVRRGGKDIKLSATVAEQPKTTQTAATEENQGVGAGAGTATALGLDLVPLDAGLRERLHVPKEVNGVVVRRIAADSPAMSLGIQPGDVIVSVDEKPAGAPKQAAEELKKAAASGNILLLINRHGMSEFVGLSVQNPGMSGE